MILLLKKLAYLIYSISSITKSLYDFIIKKIDK